MSLTDDRNDPDLHVIENNGMQKKYLVLSEEERKKGFAPTSATNLRTRKMRCRNHYGLSIK